MPLRRDIPAVASIENISEIPIDLFEIFKMKPKEVVEIDFTSLIERIANRVWDAAQNGAAGGVLKVTVIKSRVKEPPKPDNAPPEPTKAPDAPPVKTPEPPAPPVPAPTPETPAPAKAPEVPAPAAEPVTETVKSDVKSEEPKSEEPKSEEPKAEEPKAEEPKATEPPKPVAPNPLAAFMKPAKKK